MKTAIHTITLLLSTCFVFLGLTAKSQDCTTDPDLGFTTSCNLLFPGNTAVLTLTSAGDETIVSYQWNLNSDPINGATEPAYTTAANAGGDYSLTIIKSNGCSNTSAVTTINNLSGPLAAGNYSIPAACGFNSINSAVSYLNANGLSGTITFNIAAGYVETAPAGGIVWDQCGLPGSLKSGASQTVTFQKSGTGNNPLINSSTGTGTSDAIIKIMGGDYLTFDGIDVSDAFSADATFGYDNQQVEYGYQLLKCDGNNGCNYNTIKNCTIKLHGLYQNSTGIYSGTAGYVYTGTTGNAAAIDASRNGHNSFYGITFQGTYQGISLNGATGTSGNISLNDMFNSIGVAGEPANNVTNFGELNSNASAISVLNQQQVNIENNNISCSPKTGSVVFGSMTAINVDASLSARIRSNMLSLSVPANLYGINCKLASGTSDQPGLADISGNRMAGYYSLNNCHDMKGIFCSAPGDSADINVSNNYVQGFTSGTGNRELISVAAGNRAAITMTSDSLVNNSLTDPGFSGLLYPLKIEVGNTSLML